MSTSTNNKENTPALWAEHVEYLRQRAIPVDFAVAHGLRSIDLAGVKRDIERGMTPPYSRLPLHPVKGFLQPYQETFGKDGKPQPQRVRFRSDKRSYEIPGEPGTHMMDKTVEVPRYLTQAGMPVIPYLPKEVLDVADDTSVPIYITESPGKALALTAHGFLAIGLGGVSAGAHDKTELDTPGEVVAHPELRRIKMRGRRVYITFDAGLGGDDDPGNPLVAQGASKVWKVLSDLGADVWLLRIPYHHPQDSDPSKGDLWSPTDQGPDDFLYRAGLGIDDPQEQMIARAAAFLALPAVPADPQERLRCAVRDNPHDQWNAVGRVLNELFVQACLQVAGEAKLSAVAAVTKGIVGKRGLNQAVKGFEERVRGRFTRDEPEWLGKLSRTATGAPRCNLSNVVTVLQSDAELRGLLAWNDFTGGPDKVKDPPWLSEYPNSPGAGEFENEDLSRLITYLEQRYEFPAVPPALVASAVDVVAQCHRFHPVRDYFDGLKWDQTSRLDTWLTDYLHVADTPYTRWVARKWLISAVARTYEPGCQADYVLVLEGKTRIGKTSALRALALDKWHSEPELGSLENKEAVLLVQACLIAEFGEGQVINRATAERLKQFITTRWDDIIPKYLMRKRRYSRHSIFAMTVNRTSEYLLDDTGNARFLPVDCGDQHIDLAGLRAVVDLLWAEATAAYKAGEQWHPTVAELALAETEQAKREKVDPWLTDVARYLSTCTPEDRIDSSTILFAALHIPVKEMSPVVSRRLGAVMRKLGWHGESNGKGYFWRMGAELSATYAAEARPQPRSDDKAEIDALLARLGDGFAFDATFTP